MAMKIAVFTVCMPELTPEEAAPKLAEWGYDGVEWRVTTPPQPGAPVVNYWNGNRCTVDPATILERAPALRALCRKHKLAMPVLGTYLGYEQLDLIEKVMDAAAVLGHKGVRVSPGGYNGKSSYQKELARAVKAWEKVVKLGRRYKVKPMAEIHMGNLMPSCSAAWRFASHFSPADMGVIHDAGNMICEGYENWQMGLEILGPYLAHVHVKNGSWAIRTADPDGNLRWAYESDTLRRGRVNWRDVIGALKKVKYNGWLSLEDFAPGVAEAKLKDDLQYLRQLIREA